PGDSGSGARQPPGQKPPSQTVAITAPPPPPGSNRPAPRFLRRRAAIPKTGVVRSQLPWPVQNRLQGRRMRPRLCWLDALFNGTSGRATCLTAVAVATALPLLSSGVLGSGGRLIPVPWSWPVADRRGWYADRAGPRC